MGLFDRFKTKHENVHYDRDTGNVTRTITQGDKKEVYVNDKKQIQDLTREEQVYYPYRGRRLTKEQYGKKIQKKAERKQQRRLEHDAYMQGMRKARVHSASMRGYRAGTQRFSPSVSPYRITNNYNPFGSMFDTGMKPMSKPKTTKKKKKKGKHTTKTHAGEFDMLDNWGYFK